jgi:hypothetical protein
VVTRVLAYCLEYDECDYRASRTVAAGGRGPLVALRRRLVRVAGEEIRSVVRQAAEVDRGRKAERRLVGAQALQRPRRERDEAPFGPGWVRGPSRRARGACPGKGSSRVRQPTTPSRGGVRGARPPLRRR